MSRCRQQSADGGEDENDEETGKHAELFLSYRRAEEAASSSSSDQRSLSLADCLPTVTDGY